MVLTFFLATSFVPDLTWLGNFEATATEVKISFCYSPKNFKTFQIISIEKLDMSKQEILQQDKFYLKKCIILIQQFKTCKIVWPNFTIKVIRLDHQLININRKSKQTPRKNIHGYKSVGNSQFRTSIIFRSLLF